MDTFNWRLDFQDKISYLSFLVLVNPFLWVGHFYDSEARLSYLIVDN
jgi:hypothetical protein